MRVIFMHAPKTGGTTIHNAFRQAWPVPMHPHRFDDFRHMKDEELGSFAFYSAHMMRESVERLKGSGSFYTLTIFRQPLDRLISLFDFWRSHTRDATNDVNRQIVSFAQARDMNRFLRDIVSPSSTVVLDNYYVRAALIGGFDRALRLEERHVHEAIAWYEKFDRVGITDYLEETSKIVFDDLGLPFRFPIGRARDRRQFGLSEKSHNAVKRVRRDEVDAALAHAATWADEMLFTHFRRRFEEEHKHKIFAFRVLFADEVSRLSARATRLEGRLEAVHYDLGKRVREGRAGTSSLLSSQPRNGGRKAPMQLRAFRFWKRPARKHDAGFARASVAGRVNKLLNRSPCATDLRSTVFLTALLDRRARKRATTRAALLFKPVIPGRWRRKLERRLIRYGDISTLQTKPEPQLRPEYRPQPSSLPQIPSDLPPYVAEAFLELRAAVDGRQQNAHRN